jgi:ABC-type multidrug transport system permease subunit
MRILLTVRNKMFIFFTLVMPFAFFFLYAGVFAKGEPHAVAYFLGPVVALTVMGSFWGLSAALVMYREQGILRRFHVTPVTAADMLASSVVANFVLVLPTVILQFLFSRFIFHVTAFGNLYSVLLLVTIGTISFASMGLVVASVTNTMQETQIINQIIWFIFLFLSGATIPFPKLPAMLQKVAIFLPATYLVSGLQRAMVDRTSILELGAYLASLVGCALIAFVVSAQLFRWEPETKAPRQAKLWAAVAVIPFLLLGVWESVNGDLRAHAMKDMQSLQEPYTIERIER